MLKPPVSAEAKAHQTSSYNSDSTKILKYEPQTLHLARDDSAGGHFCQPEHSPGCPRHCSLARPCRPKENHAAYPSRRGRYFRPLRLPTPAVGGARFGPVHGQPGPNRAAHRSTGIRRLRRSVRTPALVAFASTPAGALQAESARLYQLLQQSVDASIQQIGFLPQNNGTEFESAAKG